MVHRVEERPLWLWATPPAFKPQRMVIRRPLVRIAKDGIGTHNSTEPHCGIRIIRMKVGVVRFDGSAERILESLSVVIWRRTKQIVKRLHCSAVGWSAMTLKVGELTGARSREAARCASTMPTPSSARQLHQVLVVKIAVKLVTAAMTAIKAERIMIALFMPDEGHGFDEAAVKADRL